MQPSGLVMGTWSVWCPSVAGSLGFLAAQTPLREARSFFRGLELSEGTRGSGNPGTVFALESAAFSLAIIPAVLEWRTVLRGQGSSEIDQKLDRRPCQVTATARGSFGAVAAFGPDQRVGSSFLPLLMSTSVHRLLPYLGIGN